MMELGEGNNPFAAEMSRANPTKDATLGDEAETFGG